jgi:hypothetical protein
MRGHSAKMSKEDDKVKWYLRPVSVVLSLFFVLGPFGLPLLFKSPKFSRKSKIILTLAVIVYSSYLIFVSLEIARELYKRMEELKEILG